MLLDLSESLACPRCGPPQVMLVLVERMEARRVLEGRLDCPACESRYGLHGGHVRFDAEVGPKEPAGRIDPEDGVIAAALLGIRSGKGVIVVDSALGPAGPAISELSGGCEVVRLETGSGREGYPGPTDASKHGPGGGVTILFGAPAGTIPLLSGRAVGVVLEGGEEAMLRESARVLVSGGRVVVLRPSDAARELLLEEPFRTIAADERAAVAGRT